MQHGVAIGRGAKRGAEMGAKKRGAKGRLQNCDAKVGCRGVLQWGRLQEWEATWDCNRKGCKEGCRNGCKKEGSKGGLQSCAANVACSEGFCNGRGCNKVIQCGVAIGRGARRGAKVDANKRGAS